MWCMQKRNAKNNKVDHCIEGYTEIHEGFDICLSCFDRISGDMFILNESIIKLFKNVNSIIIYWVLHNPCDLAVMEQMMDRSHKNGRINDKLTININQCYWNVAYWISGMFSNHKFSFPTIRRQPENMFYQYTFGK